MGAMPPVTSPADADHDDTAPTDPADASTGQAADTDARDAERGVADIAQRLPPVLPALRTGALLSVIGAVALFFAWGSGVHVFAFDARNAWWTPISGIPAFWALPLLFRLLPHRSQDPDHGKSIATAHRVVTTLAISGIVVYAFRLIWKALSIWSSVLSRTGINTVELIVIAAGTAGLALLAVTDILIHTLWATALSPNPPRRKGLARLRRSRKPVRHPEGPRRRTLSRAALVLAPSLILAGAAAVPLSQRSKAIQKLAAPSVAKNLPTYPTSLADKPAWVKDIDNVLDIVAGAAGPVIHTADGVMGLNPADGSVLWSYSRKHTTVAPNSYSDSRRLITSPDGKYVATRIQLPTFVASPQGDEAAITLVFDALTGRIVFERQGNGGSLQLTDSAVLDDAAAFSLADGSQMWTLSESSNVYYSGPAGHASFILRYNEDHTTNITPSGAEKAAISITVFPQNNPTAEVEVQQILSEFTFEDGIVNNFSSFIEGWVARYTGEVDSSGNPMAEAISLDALAKVDGADAKAFPLGATSGINTEASHLSGSIVTYPVITADAASKRPHENARAAAVFDPATRTVTPASQDRSLAAARTGIVEIPADDGSTSAALVIRPGDGSAGTSIPITPGSTFQSPRELADYFDTPAQPLFYPDSGSHRRTTAVRTPGAIIVTFNATGIVYGDCYVASKNEDQRCRETYRIFGVAGGQE